MRPNPIHPGPGQESAWDYPRPPALERTNKRIQVIFNRLLLADTRRAWRVLETSHPPVYYIPPSDIRTGYFRPGSGRSFCEWKGEAGYYSIVVADKAAENAAWFYSTPAPRYLEIRNHVAFYPSLMDACLVDGELARPQPGNFYGGWITDNIVGPFKGEPGTMGW